MLGDYYNCSNDNVDFHIFVCTGEDGGTWFLDLKSKGGKVGHGEPSDRADVVMSMATDDFVKMFSGKFSTLLVHLFRMEYFEYSAYSFCR